MGDVPHDNDRAMGASGGSGATSGPRPERWWNAVIEVRVPFDTREQARYAFLEDEDVVDKLYDIFGDSATISGTVEEMSLE